MAEQFPNPYDRSRGGVPELQIVPHEQPEIHQRDEMPPHLRDRDVEQIIKEEERRDKKPDNYPITYH